MVGAGFDVAESGTLLRKDLSLALELAESAAADLGGLEATAARALQLADENSSG